MIENVLVIGGGVGGTTTALAAANAGASVVLVEKRAILGGKLAPRLGGEDSSSMNGMDLPRTREVVENKNIEVLTLAEVVELGGEPGDFTVTIREDARYITDACTMCNKCRAVCPIVLPNEYEADLSYRKAIYSPLKGGYPEAYVIDSVHCLNDPPNYLPCQRCVEVCEDDCIIFDMPAEQLHTRKVGAVVVAVGYDVASPDSLRQFGYGEHKDILTSLELEYLLAPTGPTGGYVEKPSSEDYPEKALIVITDTTELSWSYSLSQITRLVEQDIDDITIIYHGESGNGTLSDKLRQQAVNAGAKLIRGDVEKVKGDDENTLHVQYADSTTGQNASEDFDLVVLASAVAPPGDLPGLAETLAIDVEEDGYVHVNGNSQGPLRVARPGVYVVGCVSGPVNVSDTYAQGKAVAERSVSNGDIAPVAVAATDAGTTERGETATSDKPVSQEELQEQLEQFVWSLIKRG